MILCIDHAQADLLRSAINTDELDLPLDISLLTFEEALEIDAISQQEAQIFYRQRSRRLTVDSPLSTSQCKGI